MGIRKASCRKYINSSRKLDCLAETMFTENIEYVATAAVRIIDRRKTLVLHLFNRKKALSGDSQPTYVIFQTKDEHVSAEINGNKVIWRSGCFRNLGGIRYGYQNISFYESADREIVTSYCDEPGTGFEALSSLQDKIMLRRREAKALVKKQKIVSKMTGMPALPRSLKGWINHDVMPAYIFYVYTRKKLMSGQCTCCGKKVVVSGVKHNEYGYCPQCNQKVQFKSSGKAGLVHDQETVQVMQRFGSGLVLRVLKIYRSYDPAMIDYSIKESARIFLNAKDGEMTADYYYNSYQFDKITPWRCGFRPRYFLSPYQYSFEHELNGLFFWKNIDSQLDGTHWQYSQLLLFAEKSNKYFSIPRYLANYIKFPMIEYLVKCGFIRLVENIIYNYKLPKSFNRKGKKAADMFGVGKEDIRMLQMLDATVEQIELCKALRDNGLHVDPELLLWYGDMVMTKDGCADSKLIVFLLRYMTSKKLINYANKQYKKLGSQSGCDGGVHGYLEIKELLREYRDYLNMAKQMEYDMNSAYVLFPKSLRKRHDETVARYNPSKREFNNKEIMSQYHRRLEDYGYSDGVYTIIPPYDAKSLLDEGSALNHCVGSYIEDVANGECIVLFLRCLEQPEEPYYTIDYRDGQIQQMQGKNRAKPTDEVTAFASRWLEEKVSKASHVTAA